MQEEQEYSEQQSSLVNQAYSVLRDPLKRAFYLVRPSVLHSIFRCK